MLACSSNIAAVGNELEWQFKIQNRVQKVGDSLLEYSGDLRMMADKAFPSWPAAQRQELLRNQFIQGVRSSTVQLHAAHERSPKTQDDALKLACRVESAQKQLHRLKHSEAASATETKGESTNCFKSVGDQDERADKIEVLSRQIRQLSEEMEKMSAPKRSEQWPTGSKDVLCWTCGGQGHIRRNCPKRKEQRYFGSNIGKQFEHGNRGKKPH